jgi:IS30 family transposase
MRHHYTHLTIEERSKASVLREMGLSYSAIAEKLKRSKSTISREFRRNRREAEDYDASKAQKRYQRRRRVCCAVPKLKADAALCKTVIAKLEMGWTPEQIVARFKLERKPLGISYATIYRAVDNGIFPASVRKLMRFKRKNKRHKAHDNRGKFVDAPSISDRPEAANLRKRLGDWESDTVLGTRRDGQGIATHVDRKSGFLIAFKLSGLTSEEYIRKTIAAFSALPAKRRRTFTFDRGKEFSGYRELVNSLRVKAFFCDPYSPWQRGTNENTNGLLRQFFPKRTPFDTISDDLLASVAYLINTRPRKRLGWKSPLEVFCGKSLHLA